MTDTHLAFSLARRAILDRILIPKYYDPDLREGYALASAGYELPLLRDLLGPGESGSRLGVWIRREFYGSGPVPYVRTSDLAHWRIRPDYKKGVSEDVFEDFHRRVDVLPGDILMVAHGTYLVGAVAIVSEGEERLVLQDHVFRLRVRAGAAVSSYFLLAALSTLFVRRQVRSRQFSADIIDKIGERHLGLRVPIPRDRAVIMEVEGRVAEVIERQSETRVRMRAVTTSDLRMSRERAESRYQFTVRRSSLKRRILIPKYYDPVLEADLRTAESADGIPWRTVGELVESGMLEVGTGVEVGKLAYGTGDIPFVRTSDIVDSEIKREVRHGISQELYDEYAGKAGLEVGDILLVRDGTYLVGASALATESDLPALICGGILRLRVQPGAPLDPYKLLGALNLPLVRRQMRARQFTRDVIDTLGGRVLEVKIPSPRSSLMDRMGDEVKAIIAGKEDTKTEIGRIIAHLEPPAPTVMSGRPSWSMR